MTQITSSIGEVRDVDIDVDFAMSYEEAHPDWSIVTFMDGMSKMRISDIDLLSRIFGFDGVKDLLSQGFDVNDLYEAVKGYKLLGFTEQA